MWRGKVAPRRKEMWFGKHPVTVNMDRTIVTKRFCFERRRHQYYKWGFLVWGKPMVTAI